MPAAESVAQGAGAAEAEELRNDLRRLQAEYVNYRKRVERDRAVAGEMAVIGVLNALLPVLDDVDAARQHGDLADGPFAAIAAKLETALKTYGLVRIEETGVEFDPTIHEALIQQPGTDVEVRHRQPGPALGLQVRRPRPPRGPGDRGGSGVGCPDAFADEGAPPATRWSTLVLTGPSRHARQCIGAEACPESHRAFGRVA